MQILSLRRTSFRAQLLRTSRNRIENCWSRNMLTNLEGSKAYLFNSMFFLLPATNYLSLSTDCGESFQKSQPIFGRGKGGS
jgi:hypothetical protein